MEIYLINKETNKVIQTFNSVISWSANFISYNNNGNLGKIYCGDDEYFTDAIQRNADELNEQLAMEREEMQRNN